LDTIVNLTKSDFSIARTCATKLFYKKSGYASIADDNPYLQFLADGGYMVEAMAKLLYPEGKELGEFKSSEKAFEATCRQLERQKVTLFEATALHNNLLARIDILCRDKNVIKLIEIKSSSIDSARDGATPLRGKKRKIRSEWLPYLEDITFQVIVFSRAFPQFKIRPYLCVVDGAKAATGNTTFDKFQLRVDPSGGWKPKVLFGGNVHDLRKNNVLSTIDVFSEVEELRIQVERAIDEFARGLRSRPIERTPPELGRKCKGCEYRLIDDRGLPNGFADCWGSLANFKPHILDLYRIDLVGGKSRDIVNSMAENGLARLNDICPGDLSGTVAGRQRLQIACTALNREYVDPKLTRLLKGHRYPLHFVDFEGSRLAIPYHPGMRPYEQAAFQWSCHTIVRPAEPIQHTEWLNDESAFPNFEFAQALRHQLGDDGTVYIWSPYEVVTLREIRKQMTKYQKKDSALSLWIDRFTAEKNPRVVDLCALAKDYYFHPAMKGSLSIKHVLPAVLEADSRLQADPFFRSYVAFDSKGKLLNPYQTLEPLPIGEEEEIVREGTGAIRVYQEMMFGRDSKNPIIRRKYRKLLRQYCKLDTAAMVAIWKHWIAPDLKSTKPISR
jgi:hypothetical protein